VAQRMATERGEIGETNLIFIVFLQFNGLL